MRYNDKDSQLLLSKDFFSTSEVIADDLVAFILKEQHLFIAKAVDRGKSVTPRYTFDLYSGFNPDSSPFKKIKFPANLLQTVYDTSFLNIVVVIYNIASIYHLQFKQYRILDVSEGSTIIAVVANSGNGTNWANVYVSNSMDSEFSLSLAHVPISSSSISCFSLFSSLSVYQILIKKLSFKIS
jgi:hypothetical protein